MRDREKLNKLVVFVLDRKIVGTQPTAREIYESVKEQKPEIMREERVRGFKSFVQILKCMEEVDKIENKRPMRYKTG